MDEEYLIMVKKAPELQDKIEEKPDTLYCDGYHVYIKYPVHDEVTGEDSYGAWSWDKFREKPLWKPEKVKIPRVDDLQKIFQEAHNNGIHLSTVVTLFSRWFWEEYNDKQKDCCEQYDWNVLWLCFLMEKLFTKRWNSETKEWDD